MLRKSARSRSTAVPGRLPHWRAVLSKPLAAIGTLSMTLALLTVAAPAVAASPPMDAAPTAGESRWVFDYTGRGPQTFTVPENVTALTMLVTGGAGANPNDEVGRGGAGGLVLTRQQVEPGEILMIWVGQGGVGGGGWGWGCGGDHGHAPHSLGRDGGGGGGASAVTTGAFSDGSDCKTRPDDGATLVVGGGGGGGGGDGLFWVPGAKVIKHLAGGVGGDGGEPALVGGEPQPTPGYDPPIPGCGGCVESRNGNPGDEPEDEPFSLLSGAGGGGGGGYGAGDGGEAGHPIVGGGAAAGGGGTSWAKPDESGQNVPFYQTGDAQGDGQVILSLEPEVGFGGCHAEETVYAVPHGLPWVHVHAEGGQGGSSRNGLGGRGGTGGTIDGDVLLTTADVALSLRTGCSGEEGGAGHADGGDHGTTNGGGYTGGTGGGATGVAILDGEVFAIAGGGGGGGGNAHDPGHGGDGGSGGHPAMDGKGGVGLQGKGGEGGCQSTGHGGPGDDSIDPFAEYGGGGGGGGGVRGGCGGETGFGSPDGGGGSGGGGGGGGGLSGTGARLHYIEHGTSLRAGDGFVTLGFGTIAISTDGGSQQRALINDAFAEELTARVTNASGKPIPDAVVEFDLRGDGAGTPSGVFGLWDDGIQTRQVLTGADGVAHSGIITAGPNPGAWTATAALPAITIDDVAHFQLKNDGLPTTTTANVNPKPAQYLAPITFAADVTTEQRSAHGTVDFWIDGINRYTSELEYSSDAANDSVATAVYSPNFDPDGLVLEPGEHTLHVVYGGDEAFAESAATTSFSVVDAQSTTTIESSMNPAPQASEVTYDVTTTVPEGSEPLAGYDVTLTFASGAGTTVVQGTLDEDGAYRTEPLTVVQNTEVTAQVSGDGPVAGSSAGLFQYVIGDGDLVAVMASSSLNPAAPGQPIELTAGLTPPDGGPVPTGTVRFTDGSSLLCEADVVDSAATCTGANPEVVGGHRLVATYSGDSTYSESYGLVYQETIPGVTATMVQIAPTEKPVFGQPVSFTADVSLVTGGTAADELTGTVVFTVDGDPLGDPVAVAADGTASSATIDSLEIGEHHVVAAYSGDTNMRPSSGELDTVIWAADTDLALTASAEPSAAGAPVTFTAAVTPTAPGAGTPAGTVQFTVDGEALGDPVTLANGTATSSAVSTLALGEHDIKAEFASSDAHFIGSQASITHRVATQTHVHVSSSVNPAPYGAPLTVTATVVAADGTPATGGTVAFTVDGVTPPACGAVDIDEGTAACDLTEMSPGSYTVQAEYSGTDTLEASTGMLVQEVTQAATATIVTSSANPSISGEEVHFTATLNSRISGIFSGTVQFLIDGSAVGNPVPVVDGSAVSEGVSDLGTNTGHEVVARYSGDAEFAPSSGAMTQWVGADRTVTTVTSSVNPSAFAEGVTFTATVTSAALVPPGEVRFSIDGEQFGDPVPVTDGIAVSPEILSLGAGEHRIDAEFFPEPPFPTSSGTLVQTVEAASSSVTLTSSAGPSAFGSPVTFTATVTGDGPEPNGDLQFLVDGVEVGSPVPLSAGVAVSVPLTDLAVGHHDVVARYLGDADHVASSTSILQRVSAADSTTAVTSSQNPAQVGTAVSFTATVSGVGAIVPSGDVQFSIDGDPLGAPVTLIDGTATSADSSGLGVGPHEVAAEYLGDGSHAASSATLTQRMFAATTTEVSSSAAPSVFGQPVTFTAEVAGTGADAPTGDVQFLVDGVPLGDPVTLEDGHAQSESISDLSVADHAVTVTYDGDDEFGPSTGELTQTVTQAATTTTVTSSANPSEVGEAVRFTASVSAEQSAAEPTGSVQFSVDGLAIGAPVPLADGAARSEDVIGLTAGGHSVTAEYLGDAGFAGSEKTITQEVTAAESTITMTSSENPAVVGTPVQFTATVGGGNAGLPTGDVQFQADGDPIGSPAALIDGVATSTGIDDLVAGTHTITAEYLGDRNHTGSSTTFEQRMFDTATTTEITPSAEPSVFGEPVSFTADVTGTASDVPTGSVQFTLDGEPFGEPVSLKDGRAESPAVDNLSVADHTVAVTYAGTDEFGPSSGEITHTVVQATTTTTLTSSSNPSGPEDAVTFTASVVAAAPSGAAPTGVVQFSVDGVDVGAPVAVDDGSASSEPVSGLVLGDHDVVANYLGDADFFGSTDAITQTVAVDTETTLTSSANPSKLGEAVTFSATIAEVPLSVAPALAALAATAPAGAVQFTLDGAPYGAPIDAVDGAASISIPDMSVGAHTITATFTGSGFAPSTGSVTQQVDAIIPPTPPVPPTPPAPPNGGGNLPSTGIDFAPVAGVGLGILLLALGAALSIMVVRRRRREV